MAIWKWLVCGVLGLAVGAATTIIPMAMTPLVGKGHDGWTYTTRLGTADTDPYVRAAVALFGIWALRPEETMYASANVDTDGLPLLATCTYAITGGPLDTRWWSLTAYQDNHFVPNANQRYSWSKTTIATGPEGEWRIVASAQEQPGHWLPLKPGAGTVVFSLRFYNPTDSFRTNLKTLNFPRVEKVSCP